MDDETDDDYSTPSLHGRRLAAPDATPAPDGRRSRRGFLVAGGLVAAAAAGAGVVLGRSTGRSDPGVLVAHVPPELAAAAAAERALIAVVDAALRSAHGHRRTQLRLIRADHVAHLAAVAGTIAEAVYPAAAPSASPSPSPSTTPARVTAAQVRSLEKRAGTTAAARAMRLTGGNAALLASIAAAEAAHAELLT